MYYSSIADTTRTFIEAAGHSMRLVTETGNKCANDIGNEI